MSVRCLEFFESDTSWEHNFFSLRDTPLRYPAFLPQELAVIGEDNVIRLLDKHKVDYIVIVGQQAEEYNNLRFFGIDYGRKINSWIHTNRQGKEKTGGTKGGPTQRHKHLCSV